MRTARTQCDNCGDDDKPKIAKIYKGKAYCRSCYNRLFVTICCLRCRKTYRVHKFRPEPNCSKCKIKNGRRCGRCEQVFTQSAGCLFNGVYICASCSHYFRSSPKKTSKQKLFTCSRCRKYRVAVRLEEGMFPLCKDCLPEKQLSHDCPDCKRVVPGSGNSRCDYCSILRRGEKAVNLNKALFEAEWCKTLFTSFYENMLRPLNSTSIVSKVQRYAQMYKSLEKNFDSEKDINQISLQTIYGLDSLRKHAPMLDHLIQELKFSWSVEKAEEQHRKEKIRIKVTSCQSEPWADDLYRFYVYLNEENPELKQKTITSYINTAINFFRASNKHHKSTELLTTWAHYYAIQHKGQRASLTKLFSFLGLTINIPKYLKYPARSTRERQSLKVASAIYGILFGKCVLTQSEQQSLLIYLIHIVYALPLEHLVLLKISNVSVTKITSIQVNSLTIDLNEDISLMLNKLLVGRRQSDYIFCGMKPFRCMSTDTVRYHLRKLKIQYSD